MSYDLSEFSHLVLALGVSFPLVLLPSVLMNILDVYGWRTMVTTGGRSIGYFLLFNVHVSSESIARSLPLGVPLADSLRMVLLKKEHGLAVSETLVSILVRRWSLGLSQSVYVLIGIMSSYSIVVVVSRHMLLNDALVWMLVVGVSAVAIVLAAGLLVAETVGVATRVHRLLSNIPFGRLRSLMNGWKTGCEKIDENFLALRGVGARRLIHSSLYYFASWLMELLETYILLHALGFSLSIQETIALESVVSALRLMAFFLPGGIGIQDAGYMTILMALGAGVAPAGAAAFVIAKRLRDVVWVVFGYGLLLLNGVRPTRRAIALYSAER